MDAAALQNSAGGCVDEVQLFAGFEADGFAGCNADLSTSAGVAANAGFAGADAEDAKATEFNALAAREGFFQTFEDCIDDGLCLGPGKAGTLDNLVDNVLFNQCRNLALLSLKSTVLRVNAERLGFLEGFLGKV